METETVGSGTNPVETPAPMVTEAPVKRGRGRPKGSKNKPKVTQPDSSPLEVVKRRGRPRKNPIEEQPVKRGRGRPKGSTNKPKAMGIDKPKRLALIKERWAKINETPEPVENAPVKRGRGRPRKNPVVVEQPIVKRVVEPTSGTVMIRLADGTVVPRGRGRPPKGSTVVANA